MWRTKTPSSLVLNIHETMNENSSERTSTDPSSPPSGSEQEAQKLQTQAPSPIWSTEHFEDELDVASFEKAIKDAGEIELIHKQIHEVAKGFIGQRLGSQAMVSLQRHVNQQLREMLGEEACNFRVEVAQNVNDPTQIDISIWRPHG